MRDRHILWLSLRASSQSKRGFALIATISVMVLLVLVALAMLSLSTIELRQQTGSAHQQQAQANARLALMLALGDLQKYAGADRRVTAPGSILGDSVATQKRNWTTVWDTSEWDVKDPAQSRDSQAYMAALVSRRDTTPISTRAAAITDLASAVPTSDPDWVSLVADGSVAAVEDYVSAQTVDVENDKSSGSYAYWIGDEGVKARFDVDVADDQITETWATAGRMGIPMGTGVHKISGMEGYTDYLSGGASRGDLTKFIDYRTLELSRLEKAEVKKHFHHLTSTHTGLLVDNRWGGVRRDLSTAFEIDADDFGDIEEFNASGESNTTDIYSQFIPSDLNSNPLYYSQDTDAELGFLFEVPVDSSSRYRGPTWDILRNHYRMYKNERRALGFRGTPTPSDDDAVVAHSIMPLSYISKANSSSYNSSTGALVAGPHVRGGGAYTVPMVSEHGATGGFDSKAGNRLQATVQKLTPQLLRAIFVYGMARTDDRYFLTIDPYFVFHNPYNRPLEFHSLAVDLNGMKRVVEFKANYTESGTGANKSQVFEVQYGSKLQGLQSFRLAAPASGNHRLEAGEIKIMSVQAGRYNLGSEKRVIRLSELQYNEGAGIFLGASSRLMDVEAGSTITVEATIRNEQNITSIFTRLLHPLRAGGGALNLEDVTTFNSQAPPNRNHDGEQMSLIQQMRVISLERKTLSEKRSANVNQIPSPQDGSFYMYALDIGLKDFSSDVAVMGDFNHRTLGFGPRDYDGGDSVAPNWDLELKPSDLLDLQFVDVNGNGYWGEGKTPASGGSNKIVLFDLPRAPVVSLASLQHADVSILNFHPARPIANSRLQVGQDDQKEIFNRLRQIRTSTTPRHQIDVSWAANEALWDRYYFSGMNWGSKSGQPFQTQSAAAQAIVDRETHRVLANPRMTLISQPTADDLDEIMDYRELGKHLAISGAFNVNSTSVEGWKAVLSSLSGREVSYLSGGNLLDKKTDADTAPMSRFTTPAGWDNDDYAGFRALSSSELESLAEKIVEQVKLRGPFMGLSDFVNRRLVSDDTGKNGAIQAAIDESGINSSVAIGSTSGNRLEQSSPDANEGMARHLSQGDVLTPLAPIIATRSDTFVIRAYGDSKDANGDIQARAWCEATVQRTPEWLVDTNEPGTIKHPDYPTGNSTAEPILRQWQANPDLPDTCKTFGRKFKVQSFRWLSADEV